MAQTLSWRRGIFSQTPTNFFGHILLFVPDPSHTIRRTYWSWRAHQIFQASSWPPGSEVTRVALWWGSSTITPSEIPTPISQPNEDYVDIRTVVWDTQAFFSGNNLFWDVHSRPPVDEWSTQGQRKQTDNAPNLGLYVTWETSAATDTVSPFNYAVSGAYSILDGAPPA